MKEINIVIVIEGGLVQAAFTNTTVPVRVAVVDFDIKGADPDEMSVFADGREFIGHIEPAVQNIPLVKEAFAAFDCGLDETDARQDHYLAHGGALCPDCGSRDITVEDRIQTDGPVAFADTYCCVCGATWQDVYSLHGFEKLEPGKKQTTLLKTIALAEH